MSFCQELLVPSGLPPLPQVREDLDGCTEGAESIYEVWFRALGALKALAGTLDDACLDRLFWRENRMVTLPPPVLLPSVHLQPQDQPGVLGLG